MINLKKSVSAPRLNIQQEFQNPDYLTRSQMNFVFLQTPQICDVNEKIRKRSDQEIHKSGAFNSMTHGCDYILNLEDYFNKNSYMHAIEMQINDGIYKPKEDFVKNFNIKFDVSRSILISFESTVDSSCIIVWRFRNSERFFCIKINDDDCKEFVKKFLKNSIKLGHNGLLSCFNFNQNLKIIDVNFDNLGDVRQFNLLFLASLSGDLKAVKFCLQNNFDTDEEVNGQIPADLAYNIRNFKIILELLKANSPFPREFKISDVTGELKTFVDICKNIHENIKWNNKVKVKEIINQNPNLKHFYDLENNSALTCLITNRKFKIYHALVKRDVTFGLHENTDKILGNLSQNRMDMLNKINRKLSKNILQVSFEAEHRPKKSNQCCL